MTVLDQKLLSKQKHIDKYAKIGYTSYVIFKKDKNKYKLKGNMLGLNKKPKKSKKAKSATSQKSEAKAMLKAMKQRKKDRPDDCVFC